MRFFLLGIAEIAASGWEVQDQRPMNTHEEGG
jgi:hypothetical protein